MTVQYAADRCWVCLRLHLTEEFPKVDGVPITYGYMPPPSRDQYNAMPKREREKLRVAGIARYEAGSQQQRSAATCGQHRRHEGRGSWSRP